VRNLCERRSYSLDRRGSRLLCDRNVIGVATSGPVFAKQLQCLAGRRGASGLGFRARSAPACYRGVPRRRVPGPRSHPQGRADVKRQREEGTADDPDLFDRRASSPRANFKPASFEPLHWPRNRTCAAGLEGRVKSYGDMMALRSGAISGEAASGSAGSSSTLGDTAAGPASTTRPGGSASTHH
jgi:hypothetical protein